MSETHDKAIDRWRIHSEPAALGLGATSHDIVGTGLEAGFLKIFER